VAAEVGIVFAANRSKERGGFAWQRKSESGKKESCRAAGNGKRLLKPLHERVKDLRQNAVK